MVLAGKFVSYAETEYVIEGKKVIGRLLNVTVDGHMLPFKGANISRDLNTAVFDQYATGDDIELRCSVSIKDYKDLKGERTIKVPTIFVEGI